MSSGPAVSRKLAAILHADVAGYTALTSKDETATHAELRICMDRAARIVTRHGGRIVSTAGDAFLADFATVEDAVRAATVFQDWMSNRPSEPPLGAPLLFRIGLNLGEVIVDQDDIFGDGVNVAARVQALAPPGGIAISRTGYDVLGREARRAFRDLGDHRVKNFPDPVRVYATGQAAGRRVTGSMRRWLWPAAVAAVLGIAALAVWTTGALTPAEMSGRGSPDAGTTIESRPTIAVLPLKTGGAEQDYFSAGVTEDIISQLGRFSGLRVLSWSAVAPFAGTSPGPGDVSDRLRARYIVGGSVRRSDTQIRVSVQLTEAGSGVLLWSEKYDEPVSDLFAIQDRISQAVVRALAIEVNENERKLILDRPTEFLTAYELVLQGRALLKTSERDVNLDARRHFERALAIDRGYADAHVGMAHSHLADIRWGWSEFPQVSLDKAETHASEAIARAPGNASAHAAFAQALRLKGDYALARVETDRAIELNPSDPHSHAISGDLHILAGEYAEAEAELRLALRLHPYAPGYFETDLGLSLYMQRRYQDVVTHFSQSGRAFSESPAPHAILAASYAQLGRGTEASAAVRRVKSIYPFFNSGRFALNNVGEEAAPLLLEGLHKAGLD